MSVSSSWKVPKWMFLIMDGVLIGTAALLIALEKHPITSLECFLATLAVIVGTVAGCLPFILDYRATSRMLEINALGEVCDQMSSLKDFTEMISAATRQWDQMQETTAAQATKTTTAAREISDRISAELKDFTEFQKKMNDAERGSLRLEVDKLRRIEGDWLQVVVRMLDHIYALHTAANRSGQPELAGQISHFQNACRDAARRVGLNSFVAEPGEPFDKERHRVHGTETQPDSGMAAETLAPGLTLQGRMIRPALIRLQDTNANPTLMEKAPENIARSSTESGHPEILETKSIIQDQPAQPVAASKPTETRDLALESGPDLESRQKPRSPALTPRKTSSRKDIPNSTGDLLEP